MTTRLRRVSPLQLGIVMAVLYALLSLIVVLLMVPFFGMMHSMMHSTPGPHPEDMFVGLIGLPLLFLPIVYGIFGFIGGLITALIYNLVANWTGGIEITLESTAIAPGATSTHLVTQ